MGGYQFKARHGVLAILIFIQIVSFIDRKIMYIALPYVAKDYHLGPVAMGLVISAFSASFTISQIPGGILADRFGVRRVASFALLWWSVFTAVTGATANFAQLLLARFGFGLGEGLYPACLFKTVAVWFPKKSRATVTAALFASSSVGKGLAPLILVNIVAFWGWRSAFYSLFAPGLLMAVLFWFFVRDKPAAEEEAAEIEAVEEVPNYHDTSQLRSTKGNLSTVIRMPNVSKWFFVLFAFDVAAWGFPTWLPTYLVNSRGFTLIEMGQAASLSSFAGVAGAMLGGLLSDKYFKNNRMALVAISQIFSAASLLVTFLSSSVTVMVIGQTMAGFWLAFFYPAFWALPMNFIPKQLMGVSSGFINTGGQLAAVIAPVGIGYLVSVTGGNFALAFAFPIVSLLVSCAIIFTIRGKTRNDAGTQVSQ